MYQSAATYDLPPIVGRQRELGLVWSQFEAARAGRFGVVLLAGAPGIGKTRLLDVLAIRAAQSGAVVLRGGGSETEGMPPYLPFLEALGQHIRTTAPDIIRSQAGAFAPVLATLFTELPLEQPSASQPLPPEQSRMRLYEAVSALLAAIAAPQGLILCLDDLQWIDPASLDLLCFIARYLQTAQAPARILVLGAAREGETAHPAAFERALAELNRLRLLTTISLVPLQEAELTALAADYLGEQVNPAVNRLLYSQSEGNPFFAEELLRGWLETGAVVRTATGWNLAAPAEMLLPASIVGAVRQRLARLPQEVVDLLRTAALIGRTFDMELLAEVAGQELEQVEELLRLAGQAYLLRPEPGDSFSFSHDKIRECLYEDVTSVRRRRLHGFIGRALELRATQGNGQWLAELAFHFARSGDRQRGADYAQWAAEHALAAYAPEEAMAHFRIALELIDGADPRRGDLLFGLGDAALLAGNQREALAALEQAQAWYQAAGNTARVASAARRIGQAYWREESLASARAAFETALGILEREPGPELVGVLVDLGSLTGVSLHQYHAGIDYGRRALALAQHLEEERLVAAAGRTLGNLLVRSNDLAAGVPLLEQALALAMAADDPVEAAECCACLTTAYFWQAQIHKCHEILLLRRTVAERCHDPYQLRHVDTWLAITIGLQGNWVEAEQRLSQAQTVVDQLASPEPRAYLQFVRGVSAYMHGEYALAEPLLLQAIERFRAIGPDALVWYAGWLTLVQVAQGRTAEAVAGMDEVEALLAALPDTTITIAEPYAHLAQAALVIQDRQRLVHYYPRLIDFTGQFQDFLVDRLLGEIETLQGELATAQAHLVAAEATARQQNILWELARTLEAQAGLARARGASDAASRALLEQAVNLLEQLGNTSEARRIRERLQTHPQPVRTRLPAGLSAREAEVLRLVAAGKTNREIARELVLSERTVENHLTHIYGKIGVDNRASATGFAIRNGLV